MLEGSEGYWGKFPDVFDPSFAESLRRSMEAKKNASAGDPWCIGYFSDNEMSWGDDTSLAVGVLKSPVDQPAKRAPRQHRCGRDHHPERRHPEPQRIGVHPA